MKKNPFDEMSYYKKEMDALDLTRHILGKKYAKIIKDKLSHRFRISGDYGVVEWNFRFDEYAPKHLVMVPNQDFNYSRGLRLTIPMVRKLHEFLGKFLEFQDAREREEKL